jgi:hypothetical protein
VDTAQGPVVSAQGLLPRKRRFPALRCPPNRVNSTLQFGVGVDNSFGESDFDINAVTITLNYSVKI